MPDKAVTLSGGLDLVTPPIKVEAGTASEALNYFESVKGGYTRIAGYERFDGQLSPSHATYYLVTITQWDQRVTPAPVSIGTELSIGPALLSVLFYKENQSGSELSVVCSEPQGELPEDLDVNPVAFDTHCLITDAIHRGAEEESIDTEYLNVARELPRSKITKPPGTGPIRGVAQIDSTAVTFRDDGLGNLKAFKSTPAGWTPVNYAQLVVCDTAVIPQRNTPCNSGHQVILGVFDYLNVDGNPDATKQILAVHNAANTPLAITDSLVRDSDSTAIGSVQEILDYGFKEGGRVRYIIHNFFASASTRYLYFTDGVNTAAVYKPEYNCIQPIGTNYRELDETFTHLIAHNSALRLATDYGTALTSVTGEPEILDGFLGAAEWGAGDTITGFSDTNTALLHTFTSNTVQALKGTSIADFQAYTVSSSSGAKEDSIVTFDDVFSIDRRGIASLKRSETLGGFDAGTISANIQPLIRELNQEGVTASCVIRPLNQFRFYFGKRVLFVSRVPYFTQNGEGTRYGITEGLYNIGVTCVSAEKTESDAERVLFGGEDGFVYQSDIGTSFDGAPIPSNLTLQYNHLGAPNSRKRFRDISLEAYASNLVNLRMYYSMNDGRKSFNPKKIEIPGGKNGWDETMWDNGLYDAFPITRSKQRLQGTGRNIEFSFQHDDENTESFTLTGYTLRYSDRGLTR